MFSTLISIFQVGNTSQPNIGLLSNLHGQVKMEHLIRKAVGREVSLRREDLEGEWYKIKRKKG